MADWVSTCPKGKISEQNATQLSIMKLELKKGSMQVVPAD